MSETPLVLLFLLFANEFQPSKLPHFHSHTLLGTKKKGRMQSVGACWSLTPGPSSLVCQQCKLNQFSLGDTVDSELRLRKQVESPRVIRKALHQSTEYSLSFSPHP